MVEKKYYRYSEEGFSLFAKGFTDNELVSLKETSSTLQRFKGLPSFQWMDSMVDKLERKMKLKSTADNVLSIEENAGYVGIEWLKDIFDAIVNKQPLKFLLCRLTSQQRLTFATDKTKEYAFIK